MIVMCISGFVVSGFEHCIANMGIFVTAYCLVPGLSLGAIVKEHGSSNFRKYGGRCPVAGMAAQKDECR